MFSYVDIWGVWREIISRNFGGSLPAAEFIWTLLARTPSSVLRWSSYFSKLWFCICVFCICVCLFYLFFVLEVCVPAQCVMACLCLCNFVSVCPFLSLFLWLFVFVLEEYAPAQTVIVCVTFLYFSILGVCAAAQCTSCHSCICFCLSWNYVLSSLLLWFAELKLYLTCLLWSIWSCQWRGSWPSS